MTAVAPGLPSFRTNPAYQGMDYHALNAMLNLYDADGKIQFDADKAAARSYFLDHVNQNTVWFTDLEEKLAYLFENGYYEREVFAQYADEFVKGLYKQVYAHRFRFASFLGAFKAYTSYVLRTFDGKRYLERWEDRIAATALYLARGDEALASRLADEIILGRFQPATPTILNAAKAQRGELVSCFEAGTLITTREGQRPIEAIEVGDYVLTHRGRYMPVTEVGSRLEHDEFVSLDIAGVARPLRGTGEHPVLVWTKRDVTSVHDGDGAEDGLKWVSLRDVRPGDYVFLGTFTDIDEQHYSTVVSSPLTDWLMPHTETAPVAGGAKVSLRTVDARNNAAKGSTASVQSHAVNETIQFDESAGRLLGYFLSQGYVHTSGGIKGIRLTFGSARTRDIEDAAALIQDVFGVTPNIRVNHDGSTAVSAWSRLVGEFFLNLVGTGFNAKRLSEMLKEQTVEEFRRGIIVGIFRGDGCTVAHGVKMALSNPGLVYDIADVLLSLGGVPTVREYISASGSPTAEVTVAQGTAVNTGLIHAVDRDIEKFTSSDSPNATLHKRLIGGRAAYRVREVTFEQPTEPTRVFNLEVQQDHTYVASRVIVHNCFLLRVEDNLESISRGINSSLQLSKRGGGVALNLTNIREQGAPIKQIENQSSGIIPVMKLLEDSFSYANQLGARQGAGAVYLNAHHPDIMRFLDTKRENADEKIRIKTLSLGIVVPDISFELARNDEPMYLFSPYDVERVYGVPFGDISVTEKYREMVDDERIKKTKINAREFFQTLAEIQFESGYPYIVFEDTVNNANPIAGRIQMSNLCVTGDTQILTAGGYRQVKDLYDSQEDFDVIVDERARTMDLSAGGVKQVSSTKMFKTAEAADAYKVTTAEGFELRATEWHKMYVERDGDLIKMPLNEVEPGDKILVQQAQGAFSHAQNDDFEHHYASMAYLAGGIAADGTFAAPGPNSSVGTRTSARLYLYGDKREFAAKYEKAAETVLLGWLGTNYHLTDPRFVDSKLYKRASLHSVDIADALAYEGFTAETKLAVPEFVLRGSSRTQRAYLTGLFQLDGCVTSTSTGGASIELGSVSHELLVQVQRMLLNFGIYTRIYKSKKVGSLAMLPDGKGGFREYYQSESWSLRATTQADFDGLADLVTWGAKHQARIDEIRSARSGKKPYRTHRHMATVLAVEFDGVEDVFDVTVVDGHSVIFNGIATGNCSEILQVNTPSTYRDDLSYESVGKDISCNLGSLNIAHALAGGDLGGTVEAAIRALTAVSDLSDISAVPSIANGNAKSHAIGLGQMNLHGFLGAERIHYDSPEAVDFTSAYFAAVAYHAIRASNLIARERAETFEGFERSAYADGSFFDKYVTRSWAPTTQAVRALFDKYQVQVPSAADWASLADSVRSFGLYNQNLQAVPPTGSISYINNATSSIHPVASAIEIRKEGKLGRVYYPAPGLRQDNLEFFKDAYEVGPEAIIDVYAAATEHVDQGLSLTLFFKDTASTRDVNKAQIYAWRKGIKTIYYIRIRQMALEGTGLEGCVSCAL